MYLGVDLSNPLEDKDLRPLLVEGLTKPFKDEEWKLMILPDG